VGYGVARFIIEYFRQPDAGLDYVLAFGDPYAPTNRFGGFFNFSMGQVFSFLMIVGGLVFLVAMKNRHRKDLETERLEALRLASAKPATRKLRKKLRQ
jgi:phosphatidylglycerol:prolipoprotein diacylglycerol transferase